MKLYRNLNKKTIDDEWDFKSPKGSDILMEDLETKMMQKNAIEGI